MVIMRRVVFLLSLAASAAAAYLPAASCSRPLPTVPRSRVVRGAVALASKPLEESAGGNYAVGGGAWPAREARPPRATKSEAPKKRAPGMSRGGAGRGGRGSKKEKRGRGSPIVHNVLRKMSRLESSASLDEVDAVLGGKSLSPRDYTTVLAALKARRAWRVALRVGEWLRQRHVQPAATQPLPNRAHYQVMLGACASSGEAQAAQALADEMAAGGLPIDRTALGTLVLAHERAGDYARTLTLLDELEAMPAEESTSAAAAATDALPPQPDGAVPITSFLGSRSNVLSRGRESSSGEGGGRSADGPKPTSSSDPVAFAYASAIRAHEAAGAWAAGRNNAGPPPPSTQPLFVPGHPPLHATPTLPSLHPVLAV